MPRRLMLTVHLLVTITIAGCGLPPATARVEVNPKIANLGIKTIAILPFEGAPVEKEIEDRFGFLQINHPNNGETISDMLATELMGVGGFDYIERSQIRKVLEEQGFSLADLVHKKSASEIGRLVGADGVVLGAVGKARQWTSLTGPGCELTFSARMIHTQTGIVLWSASVTRREGTEDVWQIARQECKYIAEQVRAKLPSKPTQ